MLSLLLSSRHCARCFEKKSPISLLTPLTVFYFSMWLVAKSKAFLPQSGTDVTTQLMKEYREWLCLGWSLHQPERRYFQHKIGSRKEASSREEIEVLVSDFPALLETAPPMELCYLMSDRSTFQIKYRCMSLIPNSKMQKAVKRERFS